MKIWTLKDSRVGSSKQAEILANALSNDVVVKNIQYTTLISIPNFIKPLKMGIDFDISDNLLNDNDCPDMIVFAGRRLAGIALYLKKYLKKKFDKKIKLISILNPDYSFKKFDYVILPKHDKIKSKSLDNVLKIDGAICVNKPTNIEQDLDFWKENLKNFNSPYYFLIVGGDIKEKKLDAKKLGDMVKKISDFVKSKNGTLLITTSRRTNEDCIMSIENNVSCSYFIYKWGRTQLLNPYYAFIFMSDIVFLTGDSISMVSEIITIGKPSYVYMPKEILTEKHIQFCKQMIEDNRIKELNSDTEDFEVYTFELLNNLDFIAKKILTNNNIRIGE